MQINVDVKHGSHGTGREGNAHTEVRLPDTHTYACVRVCAYTYPKSTYVYIFRAMIDLYRFIRRSAIHLVRLMRPGLLMPTIITIIIIKKHALIPGLYL